MATSHSTKRSISNSMARMLKLPSAPVFTASAITNSDPTTAIIVPTTATSTAGAFVIPKRAATG